MITYSTSNNGVTWDCTGKSTDEKPIDDVPNGSTFYEMDTQKVFMFDGDAKEWLEQ